MCPPEPPASMVPLCPPAPAPPDPVTMIGVSLLLSASEKPASSP